MSYTDNLSSPRGCIARAQADIARILQANSAFIVTDGSTAGVLSILFTAKTLGVKRLAVCENSHKSVFNGCAALGLCPVVFSGKKKAGIPAPFTLDDLQDIEADALFITSPDYYGNIPDLQAVRSFCEEKGMLLLIDGAHGGHLHFEGRLYAGAYADLWVDGVHKSLPALTQGAVVCSRTERLSAALEKSVGVFRTTSPSYPIMISVEYAVKYPRNGWLEERTIAWEKEEKRLYFGGDWTKLCALFGKNATRAHERLQAEGIYAEFCDGNALLFYLSPATKNKDFIRLKKRLTALFEEYPYIPLEDVPAPVFLQKTGEKAWVELEKSVGQVCAETCGLFPPCTPLIQRGEVITEEKIRLLMGADNVYGCKEKKISVFKTKDEE